MTILEKNVEALKTHHPELFDLTTQEVSTDHIQVDLTATGTPRLVVRNASGEIIELHDPQDPLSIAEGTVEQMAGALTGVTVSLGLELGYFALAVVRRLDVHSRLIVYEADPAIFLTALREVDLTEILNSSRVKVVVGGQGQLRHWCTQFVGQTNGTLRVISYEPAFRLNPEAYGETAEQELDRIPSIVKAARNALIRRGPMFIESVLHNTPEILLARGVNGHSRGRRSIIRKKRASITGGQRAISHYCCGHRAGVFGVARGGAGFRGHSRSTKNDLSKISGFRNSAGSRAGVSSNSHASNSQTLSWPQIYLGCNHAGVSMAAGILGSKRGHRYGMHVPSAYRV